MEAQYNTNEWNTEPDYEPIANNRIRVVRNGLRITWFRKGDGARSIVRDLQNVGPCAFSVMAMKGEWADNSIKILKSVKMVPQQRLSEFQPPRETKYVTIVHEDDGCSGLAILECDDHKNYP